MMKKLTLISTLLAMLLFSGNIHAQKPQADYFVGKWNLLITGYSDLKALATIERKSGVLLGSLTIEGFVPSEVTINETSMESISMVFTIEGRQTIFTLNKKDENNITGSSGGGSTITGVREITKAK